MKGLVVTRIYMYFCLMKVPFVRACSIVPYPIHKIIPYTLKMQSGSNKAGIAFNKGNKKKMYRINHKRTQKKSEPQMRF